MKQQPVPHLDGLSHQQRRSGRTDVDRLEPVEHTQLNDHGAGHPGAVADDLDLGIGLPIDG